ncbi:ketopantoate reductase family protein [Halobacillus sp. B23F22_1]|uniref:ketopantoate reductase family protein n=1 Tax=Halobacillus sp. B23F22_1 TaxID=3459514 RepID=UPI00373DF5CF
MKVGIVGGGAIGLLAAAYLSQDHTVSVFVRREKQKQKLNKYGVKCGALRGAVEAYSDLQGLENQDLLIVTVKQYDVYPTIKQLPSIVPCLFLQNGMAHLNLLQELSNSCAVGVVEHGAVRMSEFEVQHTGLGMIHLAHFKGSFNVNALTDKLSVKDFKFTFKDDYWLMLAEKLVINTVINPLTALFGIKNKYVITNPRLCKLAKQLCAEASSALNLSFEEQWGRVQQIAERTGENHSSMLKDLLEHRPTEVDAICGFILQRSKDKSPYHSFVVDAIHALEIKNIKGEAT